MSSYSSTMSSSSSVSACSSIGSVDRGGLIETLVTEWNQWRYSLKLWSLNGTNEGIPYNGCAYVLVQVLDPSFASGPTALEALCVWHANYSQCSVSSYQFWHMSVMLVTLYSLGLIKFKLNTTYRCNAWEVEIASGGKSCSLENCLLTRCGKWSSTTK